MDTSINVRPVVAVLLTVLLCVFVMGFATGHYLFVPAEPAAEEERSLPPLREGMWVMTELPGFGVNRCEIEELAGDWLRVSSGGISDLWIHRSRVLDMATAPQTPRRPTRPSGSPSGSQTGAGPQVGAAEPL